MGCDMFCLLEKFDSEKSAWQLVGKIDSYGPYLIYPYVLRSRNYWLFGVLADCRNPDDSMCPIVEPRGIPKDANPQTIVPLTWHGGVHHASWLTLQEILDYPLWDEPLQDDLVDEKHRGKLIRDLVGDDFWSEIEELKKLGDPKELRVIFFFL